MDNFFRNATVSVMEPIQKILSIIARQAPVPELGVIRLAVWGDHLDLLGHFDGAKGRAFHRDWLRSGSGFNNRTFATVWSKVADFLLDA